MTNSKINLSNQIDYIKTNKWDIFAILLTISYIMLLSSFTIYRYEHLGAGYLDLGAYTQYVHNTLNGAPFQVTDMTKNRNINVLGAHFQPIVLINIPLFIVFRDAKALLITQSICIGLSIYIAYILAKNVLKDKKQSLLLAFIYSISYTILSVNIFDYHGMSAAIPLLMLLFYLIESARYKYIFIPILLLFLTKEHLGLTVGMIGLYLFFNKKQKLLGTIVILISILSFFTILFFLIPYFSEGLTKEADIAVYNTSIFKRLFSVSSIRYIFTTLEPYVYLPLLSPVHFLIAMPEILVNILGRSNMTKHHFHYTALLGPIYLLSSVFAYKTIRDVITPISHKPKLLLNIINIALITFALSIFLNKIFIPNYYLYKSFYTNPDTVENIETLETVSEWVSKLDDSNITVSATSRIGTHFNRRRYFYYFLYDWPTVKEPIISNINSYVEAGKTRYKHAEFVIIDIRDISPLDEISQETYLNLVNDKDYLLIDKSGYIEVYKRHK